MHPKQNRVTRRACLGRFGATTLLVLIAATCILSGRVAISDEPVFSGPQAGERMPPFKVKGAFGKWDGKSFDPVADAGDNPIVLFFVHARTRPAFGLTRSIMRYAATREKDGLRSAIVFLSEDPTETDQWLKRIKQYFPPSVPVGVSVDGQEGPGAYGLNRNVTVTALVGKEGKVTANFALVQPSLQADGPKIAKQIVDVLGGGKVPTVAQLEGPGRPAQGRMRMNDPKAERLLRRLLRGDAEPEQVKKVAAELETYLKSNAAARRAIGRVAKQLVDSGRVKRVGTPAAREHIKKWAEQAGGPDGKARR